ncbi:hypothetical protein DXG01_014609 [Tephrocybe rancida]|nr:hypothetical protein DXG01_014609 [Tephrocybe rancida]
MTHGSVPIKRTPLPKLQLLVLYSVQFAEPITATVILPFVNQFVRDTGVTGGDERKTGYYAGLIVPDFTISTVGRPVLGGVLAEPAKRWPHVFGKILYLTDHPYFLPCAAAGFLALLTALIAFFILNEVGRHLNSRFPVTDDGLDTTVGSGETRKAEAVHGWSGIHGATA